MEDPTRPPSDQPAAERAQGLEAYLARNETKSLLRFITCGSVDDGKSTLIGRLLYEAQLLYDDQIAALERDAQAPGAREDGVDFASLVDGLSAEREQGITIDVAYRFFSTERRKFIVADTPGHEQYTRNMATGASTADLAVLLVDARRGLLPQTRRHSVIVSLFGVSDVVLAVNKMDLLDFDQAVFNRIVEDYRAVADTLSLRSVHAIPMSASQGDNVVARSGRTPWWRGAPLLEHLETVDPQRSEGAPGFRMPVQWVCRPDEAFRGFSGRVSAGVARPGDRIFAWPSGKSSVLTRVVDHGGDRDAASAGASTMLTLSDEIDVSRGDVLAGADAGVETTDQVKATLLWMSETPLPPGRTYDMKLATARANASVTEIKHRLDVETLDPLPAKSLGLNEIGVCTLAFDRPVAFTPYARDRTLGAFILIDRESCETSALGVIEFGLRRASNVRTQRFDVDPAARAAIKAQKPIVLWFTGLSGAGKSTIANALEARLNALGKHTIILDGDNVRQGLNIDLGFTDVDRVENIRRIVEVSRLMLEAGLITMVSFISPFRAERRAARERIGDARFWEIHVDTPLEVAEQRDVKGLYRKARAGLIKNFTGIDSAYEPPDAPDLRLDTSQMSAEAAADLVFAKLLTDGYLERSSI